MDRTASERALLRDALHPQVPRSAWLPDNNALPRSTVIPVRTNGSH